MIILASRPLTFPSPSELLMSPPKQLIEKAKAASSGADGLWKHKVDWTVVKIAALHRKRCVAAHM